MMNADDILNETMRRLELKLMGLSIHDTRPDCSFCRRERSFADDNHADHCPYWSFLPRGNT